jgi:hypothetical protein
MPRRVSRKDMAAKAEKIAERARNASQAKWNECPPELRALEANKATTLSGALDADYLVRKAFNRYGLDPHNPWHWKTLLYLLAYLQLGEGTEWDDNRLALLRARCEEYPGTNTDKIRRLREDFKEDYQHIGTDPALRELLERAQKLSS